MTDAGQTKTETDRRGRGRSTGPTRHQHHGPLTERMLRAVDLLSLGRGVQQVADAVGVCRQRVSEWKARMDFQEALQERREALMAEVQGPIRARFQDALDTLHELMYFDRILGRFRHAPATRLAAARVALAFAGKALSGQRPTVERRPAREAARSAI